MQKTEEVVNEKTADTSESKQINLDALIHKSYYETWDIFILLLFMIVFRWKKPD